VANDKHDQEQDALHVDITSRDSRQQDLTQNDLTQHEPEDDATLAPDHDYDCVAHRRSTFLSASCSAIVAGLLGAGLTAYMMAPSATEAAWSAFGRARHYQDNKRYEMAIKSYDEAIRLRPMWTHPHRQQAWCYVEHQQFHRAVHAFALALKCDPESTELLVDRAFALIKMEDYESALEHLDRVIKSDRTNLKALSMRANVHLQLGDDEKAQIDRVAIRSLLFANDTEELDPQQKLKPTG